MSDRDDNFKPGAAREHIRFAAHFGRDVRAI